MKTFWLSFANEHEFGGVVIVDLGDDELGTFTAAIRKSISMGINPGPGYAVQAQELPPDEVPERFKRRLLDTSDVDLLYKLRVQ